MNKMGLDGIKDMAFKEHLKSEINHASKLCS